MLQSDVGAAGGTPESLHGADTAGVAAIDGGTSGEADNRRRRYGRRRGESIPVGETMVARLGPVGDEPFAAFDDAADPEGPARPSADTPIERLRFVALDCETTGQTPHRLVELGAVAFTLGGHVASFETLVHCTDRINPYARRIHGITTAALAGAPPADAVLDRFLRFAAGTVLVEHSADAFDTRLLARTIGRSLDNDNIDTSRLAGKLWGLRDTIGLERLCTELGVTHRGPHTALGDAEATAACFLELLALGRKQFGWNTLADVLGDGQPPPRVPAAPDENRRRRVAGSRRSAVPVGEGAAMDPDIAAAGDVGRRRRRRGGRRRRPAGESTSAPTDSGTSSDA